MSRAFNPDTFSAALEHRNPDLVVINYGTNESSFPSYVEKQYEGELIRAIGRVRAALPDASILIMSPMDRGERSAATPSPPCAPSPRSSPSSSASPNRTGCGFFNTYQAMGGNGTMARWYNRHPAMVGADLIHPSPQGARIVAQLLTGQLLIGYERYMQNAPGSPRSSPRRPSPKPPPSRTRPPSPWGCNRCLLRRLITLRSSSSPSRLELSCPTHYRDRRNQQEASRHQDSREESRRLNQARPRRKTLQDQVQIREAHRNSKSSATKSISTKSASTTAANHATATAHATAVSLRTTSPSASPAARSSPTTSCAPSPAPRVGIENPRALSPFFDQLRQLEADPKAQLVRVIQFGDSHTAADVFTGALRTLFQGKFGDGGAGFSYAGYPFAGYRIHGTRRAQSTGWLALGTHLNDIGDGMVGMGGVSLSTDAAGNWVSLDADATSLEVQYLIQPNGGSIEIRDNDTLIATVSTASSDTLAPRHRRPLRHSRRTRPAPLRSPHHR